MSSQKINAKIAVYQTGGDLRMNTGTIVLIVILVILAAALVALYFFGKKMQKKQEEQQQQIDAYKQTVSMLVIDKKRMRMKESGLPQAVIDQTPKLMRRSKLPIVKAKVGPQIVSLVADEKIFDDIPVKKEVKAVVNSGPTVITPKKQVTVEPAQAAEKVSEDIVENAQAIEVSQVKKSASPVPAQKSRQQEYKTIAPEQLSADAIQTGAGKLVIVIGQEPFNMTMMTANSGGSLGKVNGKPVIFSILSPDQPYEQMEKAESYTIRFYPTGQTEPTVILECKKLPSPATMEGMPRTYVGEILKTMVK